MELVITAVSIALDIPFRLIILARHRLDDQQYLMSNTHTVDMGCVLPFSRSDVCDYHDTDCERPELMVLDRNLTND